MHTNENEDLHLENIEVGTMNGECERLIRQRAVTCPTCTVRVVVMGSPSVGKTALINAYMHQKLVEDYSSVVNNIPEATDGEIKLEIMDTSGINSTNMRRLTIRTAHAFVLVYAVNDEESFDYTAALRHEIVEIKGEDVPIIVVGNKVDTGSRRVHPAVADCVVSIDWECEYFEVCAMENFDMDGIFGRLLNHPNLGHQFAANSAKYRRVSLPANDLVPVKRQSAIQLKKRESIVNVLNRMFTF